MTLRSALLLAAFVGLSVSRLFADDVLIVRNAPWMPYSGGPGNKPGVIIEILSLITGETGGAVDYAPLPWEEAIGTVRAGRADAFIGTTALATRDGLILPRENIGALHIGLFVRQDSAWSYAGSSSLDGRRLGAIKGRSYRDQIDRYIADHPCAVSWFEGRNALAEAIAALRDGRIDALPEYVIALQWHAYLMGVGNLFRIAHLDEGEPVYVAFSPTERGRLWARRFDEGIHLLRSDGTLGLLLADYGLNDWKPAETAARAPVNPAPVVAVATSQPAGPR